MLPTRILLAGASLLTLAVAPLRAQEGMWLISLAYRNQEAMHRLGQQLSAQDIYCISRSSLKDAVVSLNHGECSGGFISPQGLMLTNHHCAVAGIQLHSTPGRNLLERGFWARRRADELPIPGKSVQVLHSVEDITPLVHSLVDPCLSNPQYFDQIDQVMLRIQDSVGVANPGLRAEVVPMLSHNRYYLFLYQDFLDVRLVGVPPMAIGRFGGDTDNWRWPRHTGDFALYRVYMAPDGSPAQYSRRNVPFTPRHYLPVSLKGLEEGDFTLIIGYPGVTFRYASSHTARFHRDVMGPAMGALFQSMVRGMDQAMAADPSLALTLTDTRDALSNHKQKMSGQSQAMRALSVVERIEQAEAQLAQWAAQDSATRQAPGEALAHIEAYYTLMADSHYFHQMLALTCLTQWPLQTPALLQLVIPLYHSLREGDGALSPQERRQARRLARRLPALLRGFHPPVEQQLYASALGLYLRSAPRDSLAPSLRGLADLNPSQAQLLLHTQRLFLESMITQPEQLRQFLRRPQLERIANDPLLLLNQHFEDRMDAAWRATQESSLRMRRAQRALAQGVLGMRGDSLLYPDANSTMRLAYGTVAGYSPRDGVYLQPFTHLEGMLAKESPSDTDFAVYPALRRAWQEADYGPYAVGQRMPLGFLTTNDITGGNSGSPVLNAHGHLVGVVFDGNREALSSDFLFEPRLQRAISVDIRFVLFVIDRIGNARHLIDEMTLIR